MCYISKIEKMAVGSLVMALQFSLFIATKAVNAGCDCIIFDDTYGKDYGVFTSPNWPTPYDDNIDCLLYNFMGGAEDIVEITFDEFDVQKKNLECMYGDFVKLFLHLSESAVNEQSSWNAMLCGKIADIDQTHYSSGHSLIFEFHSDWQHGNNTGFRGTYRFISRKMFEVDGEKLPGTGCDFQFVSGNRSSNRGRFYSPQYPSSYPQNSKCIYHFMGKYNERVKIIFEQVRLQGDDLSCLNSPDVIMVHDGRDTSSPLIGQLCNTNSFVEMVSTTPDLLIEFLSRSHFPGQGFKASFIFEEETTGPGADIPSTEPESNGPKVHTTTEFPLSPNCEVTVSSDHSKNGTFTSPSFPEMYPSGLHCFYSFSGRGKERVQILFTEFDLQRSDDTGRECEGVDTVMVFITINGLKERVDNFCGNKLPAQLMSNGPNLVVEFRTTSGSSRVPEVAPSSEVPGNESNNTNAMKGFRAVYRFITNFGINSGKPDPQLVCGFIFNSSERTNGTFTSPNWPGYYPRATECHYFFRGKPNERIHITFAYFDVEGVTPCTTETASDYVEFSNFRSVDRKIPRHCGLKKPKVIESEGDFFRVTFKSNDRFDGTGFEAFYQFRNFVDPFTIKRVPSAGQVVNDGWPCCEMVLFLSAVIACFVLPRW